MRVVFKRRDASTLSLGPYPALRFEGAFLRTADGAMLARLEKHQWHVQGVPYLRLDCDGPLTIDFLDAAGAVARHLGPYAHFSSINGIAYRDHEVFCHLDEAANRWHMRTEHREWPVLVVAAAPSADRRAE